MFVKTRHRRSRRTNTRQRRLSRVNQDRSNRPPSSVPYRCSKCRLVEVVYPFSLHDPTTPVTELTRRRRKNFWERCPDDGPRRAFLADLIAGDHPRFRDVFKSPTGEVRLCTPMIVTKRTLTESAHGMALYHDQVYREWLLSERIRTRKRSGRIDLADAVEAFNETAPIFRADSCWCVMPQRTIEMDEWAHKLKELCKDDPAALGIAEKVTVALSPHVAFRDPGSRDAMLFVGVDLRRGVKEQLKAHGRTLEDIRDWLFRLDTSRSPARPKAHHVWRDAYIYMLATHKKWGPLRIGNREFPKSTVVTRLRLVQQIVRRVQSCLQRASRII